MDYAALLEAENGGSQILSYEVSVYDKVNQVWQSITGTENHFSLLTSFVYTGVNKG
jgi:hypothetical protein